MAIEEPGSKQTSPPARHGKPSPPSGGSCLTNGAGEAPRPEAKPLKNGIGIEKRLVGISDSVKHIRKEIAVLAPSSIPVIIMGETGTGKEIIARELHSASERSGGAFMPVNCATLGTLADSELFGHVKGAFTGALRATCGYVGAAHGGTLFLDEIEALSHDIQAKLLRFLDSGEYSNVGDHKILRSDVRIISSSNEDLEALCAKDAFRSDLYYRLSGAVLHTSPLRSRREDIPVLSAHFLRLLATSSGREAPRVFPNVMAVLVEHEWPGNVRQLKQVLHNLFERYRQNNALDGAEVSKLLGDEPQAKTLEIQSYQDVMAAGMEQIRRKYFSDLLSLTHGNVKDAVAISKMSRRNLYAALRRLGVTPRDFR